MNKRLTVHLKNVEAITHQKGVKGEWKVKVFNTVTFPVKDEAHAATIVQGIPNATKHYVSNIK